jgi:ABC-type ATPase with predicted acetyltransferase domain
MRKEHQKYPEIGFFVGSDATGLEYFKVYGPKWIKAVGFWLVEIQHKHEDPEKQGLYTFRCWVKDATRELGFEDVTDFPNGNLPVKLFPKDNLQKSG